MSKPDLARKDYLLMPDHIQTFLPDQTRSDSDLDQIEGAIGVCFKLGSLVQSTSTLYWLIKLLKNVTKKKSFFVEKKYEVMKAVERGRNKKSAANQMGMP